MNTLDNFKLTGQTAVVTGGGQGLGRAAALAFADAGADVVVVGRRIAPLESAAEEIRRRGRTALALTADLRDPAGPERVVAEVMAAFGKIDIWLNNAGGTDDATPYRLDETTDEHWDEVVDLNMKGVWRASREVSKVMTAGGTILNMSSILAFNGAANGYGPYGASKAAINALTKIMSVELAPRGIRVNAIAPGPVPTDTFRSSPIGADADEAQLARDWGVPLGRLGTPQDVANACLFLASPAASWCSGAVLVVAGGMTA